MQRPAPARRLGAYPLRCGASSRRRSAACPRRGGASGRGARREESRGAEHRGRLGECVAAPRAAALWQGRRRGPASSLRAVRYARPRRSTTRSGALGSPAASGLSAGRGPFRAEPFATAGWFGPFPTQQRRQRLQWAVYRGKKHAQNPRGWGLSYRSQIAGISSRRCAPIGAARARAPMAQW